MDLGSGIRDPRPGIRKRPIPDPGCRGQKGTGTRISDPGSGSATLLSGKLFFKQPPVCIITQN
jgi:hypothetical protein